MDDRFNTAAGWALAAGIAALGFSIVGHGLFHSGRPDKMGYPIEGVAEAGAAGEPEIPFGVLLAKADPAKGADVFKKCAACHTINQGGANGIGPNLWGTVGEAIAQGKGGFAFSEALKAHHEAWTFDELNEWLTNPRKFADGTKMTFAGLSKGEDRANVIAYLNSQGSNVPIPPAPAQDAAAGAAATTAPTGEAKGAPASAPVGGDMKARGETENLANGATPASGAPSVDPAAKK